MLEFLKRQYRRWRALQHFGLMTAGWAGWRASRRAEAIGILVAMAPCLPLMISDELGLARGWLWYGWAVISVIWAVMCLTVIMRGALQSFRAVLKRHRARKAASGLPQPPAD